MDLPPIVDPPPPDAHLRVSLDMWPIVWVTVSEELSLADVDYLHRVCDQVFTAEERHAFLVDCTSVRSAPGADVRKKIKDYEDSRHAISAEKGIACAIVFDNAIVRGAYTALRWISAQPVPNKAFATLEDAARWCIEAIEAEGASVPPEAYLLAGLDAKVG